jgi:hypothetical protein
LKAECLRYCKSKLETDIDDLTNNKQDSSSGIESGSSHSGSGTNSPISFDEKKTEICHTPIFSAKNGKFKVPIKKIKIFGQSINTCVEINQVIKKCPYHKVRRLLCCSRFQFFDYLCVCFLYICECSLLTVNDRSFMPSSSFPAVSHK